VKITVEKGKQSVKRSVRSTGIIAHVGPGYLELPSSLGGAVERRMVELAVAQRKLVDVPVVVYSVGRTSHQLEYHGVTMRYRRPRVRLPRSVGFSYDCALDLKALHPALIHVHARADLAWLARRFGLACPIILSVDYHLEPLHSVIPLRAPLRACWRAALESADVIAPVSEYCKSVHASYWGFRGERLALLPNGVNCDQFRPAPAEAAEWRARLGIGDRPLLLYVGRICRQKGFDVLLKAYSLIRSEWPRAALVAVGPPGRFGRSGLSPLIEELKRAGGTYVPPVDDALLPGLYSAGDVFIMPTRDLEMFGMAAVEAQACGCPVVASDHGGLVETVPHTSGLRFKVGDARDLASKVVTLLSGDQQRRELSEGALRNARQYEWAAIARRSMEVYDFAAARNEVVEV
jgi:glycosyltransferase involved in cell wall biosynthesis